MNVTKAESVNFAIQSLQPAERGKVAAWLDHLANWKNDPQVRDASKPSVYKNVFVLTTNDDLNITFSLDEAKEEITVLYLDRPSRFRTAALTPE